MFFMSLSDFDLDAGALIIQKGTPYSSVFWKSLCKRVQLLVKNVCDILDLTMSNVPKRPHGESCSSSPDLLSCQCNAVVGNYCQGLRPPGWSCSSNIYIPSPGTFICRSFDLKPWAKGVWRHLCLDLALWGRVGTPQDPFPTLTVHTVTL